MSASALPGELRASKIHIEINKKTSTNFVHPDLWPQEPVDYKVWLLCSNVSTRWRAGMFINSKNNGEVWFSLEHNIIDTAVNEWKNHQHACVCTMGQHFDLFYCRQLKNETIRYSVSQRVINVNKMCFCSLFKLSNITTLGENAIFRWCWFPQVVQKQTFGEVENYIMIWCPVVSKIFLPKIIKIR